MLQQIIWLAASAITVMVILVFVIWQRRRKRWHPADLPLVQLSNRISKRDKRLARHENEGQLAWLERLAISIDSRDSEAITQSNTVSQLTDSSDPKVVQATIMQIKQDYRQLRYGRLSTLDITASEYQKVLKQFKKNIGDLF